jgi:hypothetical protein
MAATVKIDFRIGDPSAVARSLRGIVAEAKKAAKEGAAAGLAEERRAAQASMALAKQATAAKIAAAKAAAGAVKDAAKQATAATAAEAKAQVAIEKAASRERSALIAKEGRERASAQRRAASEASKIDRAHGGAAMGRAGVEGAGSGVRRVLGAGAVVGGIVGGAVGTAGIIEAVKGRIDLDSKAATLAADVHEKGAAFMDTGAIVKQAQGVAGKTGISAGSVIDAMGVAAGSGGGKAGLDAFLGSLEEVSQLSVATGAKMEDWALISAEMTNNGITDSKKQMEIMRSIAAAGKKGNINSRDMAAGVGAVMGANQAGSFEGSGEHRARQASAYIQLARAGGAKNADDAVTAARNLYNDLGSHEAVIKKMGVKTTRKNAKGEVERIDATEQMADIFNKTNGDVTKIDPAFGMQSQALFGKMLNEWKSGGGKKGGAEAMKKMVSGFEETSMTQAEVQQEAATIMDTASKKIAVSMEQFSAKMSDELMPVLAKAIPEFAKLSEAIISVTKFATESPKTAAASILALGAAAGGAQALIGRLGSGLLDSIFKTATATVNAGVVNVNGGAPGGVGGAGGKAGMIGGVALAAVAGVAAGAVAAGQYEKELDGLRDGKTAMASEAINLSQKFGNGTATAEDRKRADALKVQMMESTGADPALDGLTAGFRGTYNSLSKGQLPSAGDALSMLPPVAMARGIFQGVNGAQEASQDNPALLDALGRLDAAMAKPTKMDMAGQVMNVIVTNAADIRGAPGQGPAAQLPPGG